MIAIVSGSQLIQGQLRVFTYILFGIRFCRCLEISDNDIALLILLDKVHYADNGYGHIFNSKAEWFFYGQNSHVLIIEVIMVNFQ